MTPSPQGSGSGAAWPTILIVAAATLLAMSLWFSLSAVVPAVMTEWAISRAQSAWLTMAVQLGFVAGALGSALLNAPDRWQPRRVFAAGALAGAAANTAIVVVSQGLLSAAALRFLTGASLALVYPVGMKIMATWTRSHRGLALGILVGALTVGSAAPHLVRAIGSLQEWRFVLHISSAAAVAAAALVLIFGRLGPYRSKSASFRWHYMTHSFRDRGLRLANLGYLGHMWELYAMWTWIPAFLASSYAMSGSASSESVGRAAAAAFAVIAAGGLGSLAAGRLADRWGRTRTTILSMLVSASCALTIGLLRPHPGWATFLALIWGFAVVADSAQFSGSVSELGEPEYMGTLLTTQTCAGFLLTLLTIGIIPLLIEEVGWTWAFAALAPGPLLGSLAMWRLKNSSDSAKLAGGRG